MKLYTEEQVIEAINKARILSDWWEIEYQYENNDIIKSLTPIEPPSDEEIDEAAERIFNIPEDKIGDIDYGANIAHSRRGFKHGAKWVIEQIKQQGIGH